MWKKRAYLAYHKRSASCMCIIGVKATGIPHHYAVWAWLERWAIWIVEREHLWIQRGSDHLRHCASNFKWTKRGICCQAVNCCHYVSFILFTWVAPNFRSFVFAHPPYSLSLGLELPCESCKPEASPCSISATEFLFLPMIYYSFHGRNTFSVSLQTSPEQ